MYDEEEEFEEEDSKVYFEGEAKEEPVQISNPCHFCRMFHFYNKPHECPCHTGELTYCIPKVAMKVFPQFISTTLSFTLPDMPEGNGFNYYWYGSLS